MSSTPASTGRTRRTKEQKMDAIHGRACALFTAIVVGSALAAGCSGASEEEGEATAAVDESAFVVWQR